MPDQLRRQIEEAAERLTQAVRHQEEGAEIRRRVEEISDLCATLVEEERVALGPTALDCIMGSF